MTNKVFPAFCLSIAVLLAISSYAQKQKPPTTDDQGVSEDDVVRISTTLVTVPVGVMDRQGRFVPDL